jgi:hypothetical protein
MISKLMGLASIGSSVANVALLQRFLEGIIGIIALTIVSAMMAGMLVVSGFYAAYVGLMHYGLDPDAAGVTIILLACIATLSLIGWVVWQLRNLRELPRHALPHGLPPVMARATDMAQAFIEGFLHPRP